MQLTLVTVDVTLPRSSLHLRAPLLLSVRQGTERPSALTLRQAVPAAGSLPPGKGTAGPAAPGAAPDRGGAGCRKRRRPPGGAAGPPGLPGSSRCPNGTPLEVLPAPAVHPPAAPVGGTAAALAACCSGAAS